LRNEKVESRFRLEIVEEKKKIIQVNLIVVDDNYKTDLDFGNVLCDFAEVKNGREHIFYQYAVSGEDFKLAHQIALQFLAIGKSNHFGFSQTVFEIYLKTINKNIPQFMTDFPVYTKLIDLYRHLGIEKDIDYAKLSEFEKDTLLKMAQISMVMDLNSNDNVKVVYFCEDLQDIVISLFYHLLKLDYTFKRCQNCGKRFVPLVNKNEEYCSRVSPQFPGKTCKEANIHLKSLERVKSNETQLLEKRVYNLYRTAACHDADKMQTFEWFKKGKLLWKERLKTGKVNEAQYKEWLKSHYARKHS
jgi:hypothetical protein